LERFTFITLLGSSLECEYQWQRGAEELDHSESERKLIQFLLNFKLTTFSWKILGPLLDPVVRNKVQFSKKAEDTAENVPADRLLEEIGGDVTGDFEFIEPKEGENDKLKDTAKREELWANYMKLADEWESTTQRWAKNEGDK